MITMSYHNYYYIDKRENPTMKAYSSYPDPTQPSLPYSPSEYSDHDQ